MKRLRCIQRLRRLVTAFFFITLLIHLQAGINDGLVAFYPMDGNGNDATTSGLDLVEYGHSNMALTVLVIRTERRYSKVIPT